MADELPPPRRSTTSTRRPTAQERANELLEAFEAARAEDERNAPKPLKEAAKDLPKIGAAIGLVLVAVGVWTVELVRSPDVRPVRPLCREHVVAELRLRVARQAQRVSQFAQVTGRPPANLAALGDTVLNMKYVRLADDSYELSAREGPLVITYSSKDPAATLVSSAVAVLSAPCPARKK
ncbi:MAG: hypothetical protein SFW08_00270 [Gemmatimonadaceae bacterium]|nr:hypothetical protein [Gemmatimonadaceae bacterium]